MRYSEIISEQYISEMRVRHKSERGDTLIAFKDSIWIANEYEFEYNKDGIWDDVLSVIGGNNDFDYVKDERPDVLVGLYNDIDNTLDIHYTEMSQNVRTSKLIQKVVKQLGIENISQVDPSGFTTDFKSSSAKGKLPEYGYHGTSLARLRQILKTGIAAQNMGNWGNIHTKGAIFFAADDKIPEFHANRTANKDSDIPVIIKFRIPDESKIFADYDVSSKLYGSWSEHLPKEYKNSSTMPARDSEISSKHKRPQNLWKDMGIFGYKGRIPPKFFEEFYTTSSAPEEYADDDRYMQLSREEMNDYMKAYVYVADNFGDVQEYVNDNWMHYTSDEIIADFEPEDEDE